jgi:ATP-grasp domain, R2K clade family 3
LPEITADSLDLFLLEDSVWIACAVTGLPGYDFPFDRFFACRRLWQRPGAISAIGRFGVTTNYSQLYAELQTLGVRLIHTPKQYKLASDLTEWYPRIQEFTPRSVWFSEPPSPAVVEELFGWPVFVKGSRQTSRHNAQLSIIHSPEEFERVAELYRHDPILHWQPFVCREYIRLRPVEGDAGDKIPPSFEFRTIWFRGECVGAGPYWTGSSSYKWTRTEEQEAIALAHEVASRIGAPFLVIDVAQTIEGKWMAIECNDGQESGYAGVSPIGLWNKIVNFERGDSSHEA